MLALAGGGPGRIRPCKQRLGDARRPGGRAAEIGGVLNMTRGIGTALGVALAGLLYGATATLLPLGVATLVCAVALASRR